MYTVAGHFLFLFSIIIIIIIITIIIKFEFFFSMFGSRVIDKKTDNETGMNSRIRMRLQPCYLRRKKKSSNPTHLYNP